MGPILGYPILQSGGGGGLSNTSRLLYSYASNNVAFAVDPTTTWLYPVDPLFNLTFNIREFKSGDIIQLDAIMRGTDAALAQIYLEFWSGGQPFALGFNGSQMYRSVGVLGNQPRFVSVKLRLKELVFLAQQTLPFTIITDATGYAIKSASQTTVDTGIQPVNTNLPFDSDPQQLRIAINPAGNTAQTIDAAYWQKLSG